MRSSNARFRETPMAATGRGCVKTDFDANFEGRETITRVPIVDASASNSLDNFLGPSISEFSHSLGRLPASGTGSFRAD
jgi:hypothetical protein